MINQLLHRDPVSVDRERHRQTRLMLPLTDWGVASHLNSTFLAAAEFGDGCREYPIVFVNAGKDEKTGKTLVAPIAVLGLANNENLFVDGAVWRGRYIPAVLRAYPFCTVRVNEERFAVCIDGAWSGVSQTQGEPLFSAEGTPSPLLESAQKQLELLETEVQRTRILCDRLVELDVLRDMRFDATLPDGRKHSVDGFLTVDQQRMQEIPDATLLELHKQGVIGLIHAHWVSLGNMRHMLEWHMQRHPATAATAAATTVQ